MEKYFRVHLATFFPGARTLVEYSYTHRPALSTQSFLTRFILRTSGPRTSTVHHVRGNSVDRDTYRIFARLGKSASTAVRFPRPLAYFSKPGYILYQEVTGDTLRQLPLQSPAWISTSTEIGRAVAKFHHTSTSGLRRLPWSGELAWLTASYNTITRHAPARAQWIRRVVHEFKLLERRAWASSPQGLVHKDFQASNIILGQPVGMIDFTLSGRGPVGFDLGTYLMHLEVMSLGKVSARTVAQRQRAFLRGYQSAVSRTTWSAVQAVLPVFQLRSAIDILAITLTYLGEKDANGRRYVHLLVREIDRLMADIPS
jgi:aminoglycoside phosphotransferase (APT) family kinase protein